MPVMDVDERTGPQWQAPPLERRVLDPAWGRATVPTDRPLVLVVDDDPDARDTVAVMLESDDISVIKASTGEAALYVVAAFPVSAIVLDVLLPDRNGYEICRFLRDDPETRGIPIIMLTALTRVVDEVAGVVAGADAFLVKPVSREQLLLHVRDLV